MDTVAHHPPHFPGEILYVGPLGDPPIAGVMTGLSQTELDALFLGGAAMGFAYDRPQARFFVVAAQPGDGVTTPDPVILALFDLHVAAHRQALGDGLRLGALAFVSSSATDGKPDAARGKRAVFDIAHEPERRDAIESALRDQFASASV